MWLFDLELPIHFSPRSIPILIIQYYHDVVKEWVGEEGFLLPFPHHHSISNHDIPVYLGPIMSWKARDPRVPTLFVRIKIQEVAKFLSNHFLYQKLGIQFGSVCCSRAKPRTNNSNFKLQINHQCSWAGILRPQRNNSDLTRTCPSSNFP